MRPQYNFHQSGIQIGKNFGIKMQVSILKVMWEKNGTWKYFYWEI